MARHSSDSLTAPLMAHNAARGCSRLRAALTTTGDGWTPLLPTTRLPTGSLSLGWLSGRRSSQIRGGLTKTGCRPQSRCRPAAPVWDL